MPPCPVPYRVRSAFGSATPGGGGAVNNARLHASVPDTASATWCARSYLSTLHVPAPTGPVAPQCIDSRVVPGTKSGFGIGVACTLEKTCDHLANHGPTSAACALE